MKAVLYIHSISLLPTTWDQPITCIRQRIYWLGMSVPQIKSRAQNCLVTQGKLETLLLCRS
jgi:hypothetical protein